MFVTNPQGERIVTSYEGEMTIRTAGDAVGGAGARVQVPLGAVLQVDDKQVVAKDQPLFTWDPYTNPIISDVSGTIRFVDLNPEFEVPVERLATWLARDDDDLE